MKPSNYLKSIRNGKPYNRRGSNSNLDYILFPKYHNAHFEYQTAENDHRLTVTNLMEDATE